MMPRRKTTRVQDRAKRIDAERARNQKTRETIEDSQPDDGVIGTACDDAYFPVIPPPAGGRRPTAVLTEGCQYGGRTSEPEMGVQTRIGLPRESGCPTATYRGVGS